MTPTGKRAAGALAAGVALVLASALMPAGLRGQPVPWWSWVVWAAVLAAALWTSRRAGLLLRESIRRVGWLLPVVALFALPAAFLAPAGSWATVAIALGARALSATAMSAAIAAWLGPPGLVRAVRDLGVPARLADVLEAMLSSLTVVLRQIRAMLRAREARRPGFGALGPMLRSPRSTARDFGRLVASLLLRSLERAEALEQARRARGGPE